MHKDRTVALTVDFVFFIWPSGKATVGSADGSVRAVNVTFASDVKEAISASGKAQLVRVETVNECCGDKVCLLSQTLRRRACCPPSMRPYAYPCFLRRCSLHLGRRP